MVRLASALATSLLLTISFAQAQQSATTQVVTETVLYSFAGNPDGINPQSGLIFDARGALYGTAASGGASAAGAVFKLTPPAKGHAQWTETLLHSFAGADGSSPVGSLIFDTGGALYGTTQSGGISGQGTVFKLTPPAKGHAQWTETVLYSFTGNPDGFNPLAGLIFDTSGALHGTTLFGGTAGLGTVFKLTPPAPGQTQWTEAVLHSFTGGADGSYLYSETLIFDASGALYGTTRSGGTAGNNGTVFKLTPPAPGQTQWTETVLYRFAGIYTGSVDGANPYAAGLIFDASGALYGTTASGGASNQGTVFELTGKKQ
jgi:uncharacterized repeat protein (TIGR03803 family)